MGLKFEPHAASLFLLRFHGDASLFLGYISIIHFSCNSFVISILLSHCCFAHLHTAQHYCFLHVLNIWVDTYMKDMVARRYRTICPQAVRRLDPHEHVTTNSSSPASWAIDTRTKGITRRNNNAKSVRPDSVNSEKTQDAHSTWPHRAV